MGCSASKSDSEAQVRTDGLESLLDGLFAGLVEQKPGSMYLPSVQVYARIGDAWEYSKAFGVMDPFAEQPRAVTVDTPYAIRSTGKLWMAVLAAALRDDGLVEFDTPCYELIPEFDRTFAVTSSGEEIDGKSITLLHCLTESNGFGYLGRIAYYADEQGVDYDQHAGSLLEWVQLMIARGKLGKPPGTMDYGGGATVLGALLEQAHAKAHPDDANGLEALLNERVADKMGAKVRFILRGQDVSVLPALVHVENEDGSTRREGETLAPAEYLLQGRSLVPQGGNGMSTTMASYGRLMRMLGSGGVCVETGARVLTAASAEEVLRGKHLRDTDATFSCGLHKFHKPKADVQTDDPMGGGTGTTRGLLPKNGAELTERFTAGLSCWAGYYGTNQYYWHEIDAHLGMSTALDPGPAAREALAEVADQFNKHILSG